MREREDETERESECVCVCVCVCVCACAPARPAADDRFLHNQYQPTRTTIIVAEQFMVTKHMRRELKKALTRAPAKKATGPDGVFAEALRIETDLSSKFILATVSKVGELGYMPSQWRETTIVPIYKEKGDPSDPANYRPITLLSQVRKIFEAAISKMIRREYKFSEAQMGFQPKKGRKEPSYDTWQQQGKAGE